MRRIISERSQQEIFLIYYFFMSFIYKNKDPYEISIKCVNIHKVKYRNDKNQS
jgi:hypothetical protein